MSARFSFAPTGLCLFMQPLPTARAVGYILPRLTALQSSLLIAARRLLLVSFNLLYTTHVRPESFGDDDRAVLLLIVLQNRKPRATDREARAVERVDVFGLRAAAASEAYLRAASLIRLEVRARRDFAKRVL